MVAVYKAVFLWYNLPIDWRTGVTTMTATHLDNSRISELARTTTIMVTNPADFDILTVVEYYKVFHDFIKGLTTEAEVQARIAKAGNTTFARRIAKLLETKRAKLAQQAEWQAKQQAAKLVKQEASIAHLNDRERRDFFKGIEALKDAFGLSIKNQWEVWGNLTNNQVAAVLRKYKDFKVAQFATEVYNTYTKGDTITIKVKVLEFRDDVETTDHLGRPAWTNKFVMKNIAGQSVSFKTNSQKLIARFKEILEAGQWVTVTAEVKWQSDDLKYVALSSKGLKVI